MALDPDRVVEVWAPGESAGKLGSGYVVRECLVLTAWHVVERAVDGRCEVRALDTEKWLPADVAWSGDRERLDAALLRIKADGSDEPAVELARVAGPKRVACEALGFPLAQVTPIRAREVKRDTERIEGRIDPLSARKGGLLSIHIDGSVPTQDRSGHSPWEGMSGAALFADRALVGVIVVHPARFGTDRLEAVPIAALAEERGFREALIGDPAAPVVLPAVEDLMTAREQQEINDLLAPLRRGQTANWTARVVEQLGHDDLNVRAGAIRSLERIAGESEHDHGPIMETLATYLRGRRDWLQPDPELERQLRARMISVVRPEYQKLAVDVQAAATALARRTIAHDPEGFSLNLMEVDLRTGDLRGADFDGAKLRAAQLDGIDLSEARLRGADLSWATLWHGNLWKADLGGQAQLEQANLEWANLSYANLQEADLRGANLRHALLSGADLRGADLRRAELYLTFLRGDALTGMELEPDRAPRPPDAAVAKYDSETKWPDGFNPDVTACGQWELEPEMEPAWLRSLRERETESPVRRPSDVPSRGASWREVASGASALAAGLAVRALRRRRKNDTAK